MVDILILKTIGRYQYWYRDFKPYQWNNRWSLLPFLYEHTLDVDSDTSTNNIEDQMTIVVVSDQTLNTLRPSFRICILILGFCYCYDV